MLIDCKEAGVICDKAQYKEAGSWEIMKLKLHHLTCKHCRSHSTKNGKLTRLCSKARLQCMDEKKKSELREKINGHQ